MEGSVNSDNKSKGVGYQDGKSGGKMQNVTMGLEVFDCSICSNPLRPPIFQCSKGNSICSPCCDKLPESDRSAVQRCYIMDRVVNNIFVPCKHGCNRKITYYNKDAHEGECLIGPCVCPVSGCGFVAPTTALLGHLTTLHKLPTTPLELFVFLGCVRPETPQGTVDVSLCFSSFEGHFQASKVEIKPDGEPKQCLFVLPGRETKVVVGMKICIGYFDNDELQEEEEKEDEDMCEYDYDFDHEEEVDDDYD
ncbi:putative E3 ubiquitin-protein ligase SINA-like 6 isoform X2 [Lolium perenne]|uniref:putative E3 ubiquitin-protein ligase SINA-like 6 isoform X2 n=1 Tax=Lolium perenne TaxID=4522 RepID=UPI0021F6162A|nr:putative E3 ubiquitin-protein ligase SINA-like 6 isoform X3 [Lolium perenne]XP_051222743.1 putative E3 ubiquitin-protein ligase SINA-like 6 isoform X4 [Lolium perenne]